MIYAFTRRGQSIVRTALINNNLTSLTSVNQQSVNDFKTGRKNNTLTDLHIYY